jgi:hypothetical protein
MARVIRRLSFDLERGHVLTRRVNPLALELQGINVKEIRE